MRGKGINTAFGLTIASKNLVELWIRLVEAVVPCLYIDRKKFKTMSHEEIKQVPTTRSTQR